MAGQQQCDMDDMFIVLARPWTLDEMVAVESHVLSGTCPSKAHHSFKDLMKRAGRLGYTTPLLDACQKRDFEGVKRIIEHWQVDIEATATLIFHKPISANPDPFSKLIRCGNTIGLDAGRVNGVTPLFVAALNNDVKLVRYLVGRGAKVSARTSIDNQGPFAGITPLHAALLRTTYATTSKEKEAASLNQTYVIRILLEHGANPSALSSDGTPTWMFGWLNFYSRNNLDFSDIAISNVSAISLLLKNGMSIYQRCPKLGRTLLHHMAGLANKFDVDEIVKLLFEMGADFQVRDKDGITPILSAAIGDNRNPNMVILKLFMEKDDIPNKEKIEALEVAAAVLLCGNRLHALEYCLSRAQELRKIEGITLIPNAPSNERAVEWATSSDLENVQQRQSELRMQSILIRLRIFSTKSWGAIYRYLWPYIMTDLLTLYPNPLLDDYGGRLNIRLHSSHQTLAQLLDISWIMLKTISQFVPTADVEEISLVTGTVVPIFAGTLLALKFKNDPLFNVETLKTSFELLSTSLQAKSNCSKGNPRLTTIKGLGKIFSLLVDQPDVMIESISDSLKEIVKLNNQASNQEKLIIYACTGELFNTPTIVRLLFHILRLLLRFGADPDAVDCDGNGPLHILAAKPNEVHTNALVNAIALLLLDAGAHLDRTNKYRLTAANVWKQKMWDWELRRKRRREEDQQAGEWQVLPEWLREDVPRLMCLSARTIRSHMFRYSKLLPPSLQSFVSFH